MCRNRRVLFVEVFICFTDNFNALVLWYIWVKTSIETRNVPFFTFVFSIKFIKSVISLRYDFRIVDIGCSNVSTKGWTIAAGDNWCPCNGCLLIFFCFLFLFFCFFVFFFVFFFICLLIITLNNYIYNTTKTKQKKHFNKRH